MPSSLLFRSLLHQYKVSQRHSLRAFHASTRLFIIKPFLLADIGEGIRECEVIQWFVQPEARVEEFDKICEVQSDKASVDIPSRFSGVIKKLHYDAGDMAQVGKPLVDIDVQEDIKDEEPLTANVSEVTNSDSVPHSPDGFMSNARDAEDGQASKRPTSRKYATFATPAVRHLTKTLDLDISHISGTGRDGRVTKDDVQRFALSRGTQSAQVPKDSRPSQHLSATALEDHSQQEEAVELSNIKLQMFKSMTRSLTIPHFMYADEVDMSALSVARKRLNVTLSKAEMPKLSYLPFIIKAISLTMNKYPILNSRVDVSDSRPSIVMRSQHNIGVAMDTPSGLVVPVIRDVASHSIGSIAGELSRLHSLASNNKLTASELLGGTITVSNIGSIGGTYVTPIIVEKEVAILGIGRIRTVPAFNERGVVIAKETCCFSWSADHRVLDGATMAKAADLLRGFVEEPDSMLLHLR